MRSTGSETETSITTIDLTAYEYVEVTRHTDPKRARERASSLFTKRRVKNDVINDYIDARIVHRRPRLVSELHYFVEVITVFWNPRWRWTGARHNAHPGFGRWGSVVAGQCDVRVGPSPNEHIKARRE
jgi:hypothetical protein